MDGIELKTYVMPMYSQRGSATMNLGVREQCERWQLLRSLLMSRMDTVNGVNGYYTVLHFKIQSSTIIEK